MAVWVRLEAAACSSGSGRSVAPGAQRMVLQIQLLGFEWV